MGSRRRRGRRISGVLLLDKPAGLTSNGALQRVKRLFDAEKAGHTGSLDPLATGVLPLCFGEATKFSQYLLDADKRYLTTIQLGVSTDSGDSDGKVIATGEVPALYAEVIEACVAQFRGPIDQLPSMFSAIKVDGQPLYKLARQGIEVERKIRQVMIHELLVKDFGDDTLTLEIACSKGTYVRTLAEDIGKVLGCGAHVIALRRSGAGPFTIDQTVTMETLEAMMADKGHEGLDGLLLPAWDAVAEWPLVKLPSVAADFFKQGQAVQIARAPTNGWVRIFSEGPDEQAHEFLGVGEILEDGKVAPRRLVAS